MILWSVLMIRKNRKTNLFAQAVDESTPTF